MTLIMGKSVATAEQMSKYLLSKNPNPKFSINISALEFAQLYLDICAKEGVRGDIAFAQCLKETGNLKYGGDVKYTQNNFAGIGATGGVPGCSFETIEIGILAQAQHLKTYATTAPLNETCVDPRRTAWFVKVKGGTSPTIEGCGGVWACPGYNTKKYKSLAEANAAKDSYGYQIVGILNDILKIKITSNTNVTTNTTTTNKGGQKMGNIYTIHAGHNPSGRTACGAVGYLDESKEARIIKDKVMAMLRDQGHTVYDCTVNDGTSANDVLKKIVAKCNAIENVKYHISIHLNAGGKKAKDGKTTGTEVLVYSSTSKAKEAAQNVVNEISKLGFKNRGVKFSKTLYVLKKTFAPCMLVEACFVDDYDDYELYNADKMAQAIVKGITGVAPVTTSKPSTSLPSSTPVVSTVSADSKKKQIIAEGQTHANNFVQAGLKVDGVCGSNTKKVAIKVLQHAMNLDYNANLKVDGDWGSKSETSLGKHYVKLGESQYMVTALEILLMLRGYDCGGVELPGVFGNNLQASLKAYQKDNKMSQTGKATADVFKSLIK